MTNILFLYEGVTSTTDLLWNFMSDFCQGRDCTVTKLEAREITASQLADCDIVLCVRGESPLMCEILRRAREAGKFIIFFLDDDLQHLPKTAFRYPGRKKYLLAGLGYADFFLTSNQLLAEEYTPLIAGNRWGILETVVSKEQIQPRIPKEDQETVRIVYAASMAHVAHWNKYIAPVWETLAQKYGNRISMTFMGMKPEMPKTDVQVTFVPPLKLNEYRAYMYEQHFDIGLSPLDTDHFSARKYYNKFIEYSMCGVCGIYSDCSPYDLVVRDGENGILAGNSPDAWQAALERAIEDKLLRENCVDNAQQLLLDVFTREQIHTRLIADIPELSTYKAPACGQISISRPAKWKQKQFRFCERLYLTGRSLKQHGVKNTLERIQNKLKRK